MLIIGKDELPKLFRLEDGFPVFSRVPVVCFLEGLFCFQNGLILAFRGGGIGGNG